MKIVIGGARADAHTAPTAYAAALEEFDARMPEFLATLPASDLACADLYEQGRRMLDLDLVISVDTAVAHLAGALGLPTWLLLPTPYDWRWMVGRDDTPWYPTMRLFRQSQPGDWSGVVACVRNALARSAQEIQEDFDAQSKFSQPGYGQIAAS